MCNNGIAQFYLPHTHEPYLPLLPSRKASPLFGRYQLILLGEQTHRCDKLVQSFYVDGVPRPEMCLGDKRDVDAVTGQVSGKVLDGVWLGQCRCIQHVERPSDGGGIGRVVTGTQDHQLLLWVAYMLLVVAGGDKSAATQLANKSIDRLIVLSSRLP